MSSSINSEKNPFPIRNPFEFLKYSFLTLSAMHLYSQLFPQWVDSPMDYEFPGGGTWASCKHIGVKARPDRVIQSLVKAECLVLMPQALKLNCRSQNQYPTIYVYDFYTGQACGNKDRHSHVRLSLLTTEQLAQFGFVIRKNVGGTLISPPILTQYFRGVNLIDISDEVFIAEETVFHEERNQAPRVIQPIINMISSARKRKRN